MVPPEAQELLLGSGASLTRLRSGLEQELRSLVEDVLQNGSETDT